MRTEKEREREKRARTVADRGRRSRTEFRLRNLPGGLVFFSFRGRLSFPPAYPLPPTREQRAARPRKPFARLPAREEEGRDSRLQLNAHVLPAQCVYTLAPPGSFEIGCESCPGES